MEPTTPFDAKRGLFIISKARAPADWRVSGSIQIEFLHKALYGCEKKAKKSKFCNDIRSFIYICDFPWFLLKLMWLAPWQERRTSTKHFALPTPSNRSEFTRHTNERGRETSWISIARETCESTICLRCSSGNVIYSQYFFVTSSGRVVVGWPDETWFQSIALDDFNLRKNYFKSSHNQVTLVTPKWVSRNKFS